MIPNYAGSLMTPPDTEKRHSRKVRVVPYPDDSVCLHNSKTGNDTLTQDDDSTSKRFQYERFPIAGELLSICSLCVVEV